MCRAARSTAMTRTNRASGVLKTSARSARQGRTHRARTRGGARLLEGLTSKEIGKALEISHRTVEIYRARLMRKYNASTAADLVHKLLAGQ
jgi:FixJ family two-component response regulator